MHAHEEPIPETGRPKHGQPPDKAERAALPLGTEGLTAAAILNLQRSAGNASVVQLLGEDQDQGEAESPVKQVVGSGGGSPLDNDTRSFMEARFGVDFGDVRLHTDGPATESARSVQANAYTVGRDVVFRSDQYSPQSDAGRRMLAHELTHVVQQQSGPVDGTPAPGGIKISDPSDRFEREADEVADRVMASDSVQRQEGEEEEGEELQMSAVQRQEGEEEEGEELQMSAVQRQEEEEEEGTELG